MKHPDLNGAETAATRKDEAVFGSARLLNIGNSSTRLLGIISRCGGVIVPTDRSGQRPLSFLNRLNTASVRRAQRAPANGNVSFKVDAS